ncbi:TonB family protein [Candidatus Methylospira mobilis]|uniref:Protein TonB n=1 Tax=Candidatus Methylospira mobilis TaxID=1808979 RepID=A0A5Q0BIB4_9GAMM|nr:energy transducer TonB [Candidatus Methylospira mobilis]QFY41894.1 TonB family protein [Candidatus Methylospira mobilis]
MITNRSAFPSRGWLNPIVGLTVSVLLHGLFWLAWTFMPHPEPKETPAQVITVSLTSAAPQAAAAAPAAPAPVAPPPPPPKPKPEPKKIEKAKTPKPKPRPVVQPEPEPEPQQPQHETAVAPPSASSAPAHTDSAAATAATQHAHDAASAYSAASYKGAGLHNPPTRYPRLALERHWEGAVRLKVEVLPNGVAGEVKILQSSGHDLLDESALEHVKTLWHFEPAHRGAQAVASWVVIPIEFKIHTKD